MSDVEKRQDRAPVPTGWTYAPAPESADIVRLQDRYGIYVGGEWRLIDATGMAEPDTMVRIGVGRDAVDVAFLAVYGGNELTKQAVSVKRG